MTKDELEAALLLIGFRNTREHRAMSYITFEKYILVRYHNHDVSIVYRETDNPDSWRDFRSMPEAAFNFIKEKLT